MHALSGWFAAGVADGSADTVLGRMLGAAIDRSSMQRAANTSGEVGVGVVNGTLACEGRLWSAIVGRPRWLDADLASLAERSGHGTALLEAYRRLGTDLLSQLLGSFSIAVLDPANRRLLLAVDRMGIETLCYAPLEPGGLIFGSTTEQVKAHPRVGATVSEQSIFNYLYCGICPSPGTIYREQRKLLPAQRLVYDAKGLALDFYWQMPYHEHSDVPESELCGSLREILRNAVKRSIHASHDGSTGAFLSGGLDSSTVAGLLSEATNRKTKTFTVGFAQKEYDEVHYAEIAARHFGTEHHNYFLSPQDVADALVDLAGIFDEPFGNSSVVPAYYCARTAKSHGVSLMLGGDGGDEIFAGNSRYIEQQQANRYLELPRLLRAAIEPLVFGLPGVDRSNFGRRLRAYVKRVRTPMPERLECYNFYQSADLASVFTEDALALIDSNAPLAGMREAYARTASRSMLQRMMHLDLKITLADNDLRKVGGACALAGVSIAYPFLDDEVVEFAAAIPPSLLIKGAERRYFFKQAFAGFLSAETIAKKKHGFGMPFSEWPRQEPGLREIAQDCLQTFKHRNYLRPTFLDQVGNGNLTGETGLTDGLLWDIMMLELWFREHTSAAAGDSIPRSPKVVGVIR